jgi:hypothetical protein
MGLSSSLSCWLLWGWPQALIAPSKTYHIAQVLSKAVSERAPAGYVEIRSSPRGQLRGIAGRTGGKIRIPAAHKIGASPDDAAGEAW